MAKSPKTGLLYTHPAPRLILLNISHLAGDINKILDRLDSLEEKIYGKVPE